MAEQRTFNPLVLGSSPRGVTTMQLNWIQPVFGVLADHESARRTYQIVRLPACGLRMLDDVRRDGEAQDGSTVETELQPS